MCGACVCGVCVGGGGGGGGGWLDRRPVGCVGDDGLAIFAAWGHSPHEPQAAPATGTALGRRQLGRLTGALWAGWRCWQWALGRQD